MHPLYVNVKIILETTKLMDAQMTIEFYSLHCPGTFYTAGL